MKKKGFTLIELLAVIVILGIVMALAIPGINMVINNSKKKSFAIDVKMFKETAHSLVLARDIIIPDEETKATIVAIDVLGLERGIKVSSFGSPWIISKTYVLIHYNNDDDIDYYFAGVDEAGNGTELIKADLFTQDSLTNNPQIIELDNSLLTGTTKGNKVIVPNNYFSNLANINEVVVYSNKESNSNPNLIPPNKINLENGNVYQGSQATVVKAPLDALQPNYSRNILLNTNREFTSQSNNEFVGYYDNLDLAPIIDKYGIERDYTISMDIKAAKAGPVRIYMQNGSNHRYTFRTSYSPAATTQYQRFTLTSKMNLTNTSIERSLLAFYGTYGTGVIPTIKNIKFSLDNSNTNYSLPWEELPVSEKPAAYIETKGGTSTVKYYFSVGTSVKDVKYEKSVTVKNTGINTLVVAFNGVGTDVTVLPGENKYIYTTGVGNGASSNQIQFRTLSNQTDRELEFVAYNPIIKIID